MRFNFSRTRSLATSLASMLALISLVGCAESANTVTDLDDGQITAPIADEHGHLHDDGELIFGLMSGSGCIKATKEQKAYVDYGNKLYKEFIRTCIKETNSPSWCQQLTRPNPDSAEIFACTYGEKQIHRFIHPDKSTWQSAFKAVNVLESLQENGIRVRRIYNWWRPEPYNKNVDGAGGRHPNGTAVDVEFESSRDKNLAFKALCRMRDQGRIKAIGYYPSQSLHLGINDRIPNTWGKSCK